MGDNRISCGVRLFDDPKSGAPYVVPLPDTAASLKVVPEARMHFVTIFQPYKWGGLHFAS